MENSVTKIARPVRRRLKTVVQRGRDRDHARRAQAILAFWETGENVSESTRRCQASRNSVTLWKARVESDGEASLVPPSRGRSPWKATAVVLAKLNELVRTDPTTLGYLRRRWSSELLAVE